jgi:hypothetical protein|uniref:Uncharacterized protein n=1 Tax=Desulfobacca acetoxidans TaxID=60893 RepID=A0A7V6A5G6_9BACT
MRDEKATVIPLHMHPEFQERHRVEDLKNALLAETLAFAQVALDNAAKPGPTPAAVKILERACTLLEEARHRLVLDLL